MNWQKAARWIKYYEMDQANKIYPTSRAIVFRYGLLVLLLSGAAAYAQPGFLLNSKSRAAVVNTIGQLLTDNYVFPDTALLMSQRIRSQWKKGAYDKITDPVAFSDALTLDLYSVYHDPHLLVQYVAPSTAPVPTTPPPVNEDPLHEIKEANFGLRKVEILHGNIGYIHIDRFWADSLYGRETVKAMFQFVAHTRALIIDVRNCGGGSQETVNMICGYFFAESTHINSMVDRPDHTTTEYRTRPDPNFSQMVNMPLYILANDKTFSAAEEFCYDLQCPKRAIIVGETTGGGAHGTYSEDAGFGFVLSIPYSAAINPVTGTNWEKTGVKPDIATTSGKALETAEIIIFENLLVQTKDSVEAFHLRWDLDLMKAIHNPVTIDSLTLKSYAGVYGERTFTFENGKLYYQRTGRPKFELEAMTNTLMKGIGNTYFKIEFVKNERNEVDKVIAYYQDNQVETSVRTK